MDRTEHDGKMMAAGVWAFLLVITAACLGGFIVTVAVSWLGMVAYQLVQTPIAQHWTLGIALLAATGAIAYARTGMQRAR